MFEEKVRFGTLYFCKGAKDEGGNERSRFFRFGTLCFYKGAKVDVQYY